jgi:hypothetical protein
MFNRQLVKTTVFLLITSVLLPVTCYCSVAVDWDALGFPDQATNKANYNETHGDYQVQVTRKNKDSLGVFPVVIHSVTGGGTAPISNSSPFPTIDIIATAVGNNPRTDIAITGSTASTSVLDPGQYFYIGGIETSNVTSINQFQFFQVGGGSVSTSLFDATPTYKVDTTETDTLNWNSGLGTITFTPSSGTSGVIFLRNTSGVAINEIKFDVDYSVATSFYFGTTTPEPSTYLILGGLLITCIMLAKRKKLPSNT